MVRLGVRSFALQAGLRSGWQLAVGEAGWWSSWLLGWMAGGEAVRWLARWWIGMVLGWMACREAVSLDGQDGCEAVCLVG